MKGRGKPMSKLGMPTMVDVPVINLEDHCKIKLTNDSEEIQIAANDLENIEELGKGGFGVVLKMRHRPTGIVMAVKLIEAAINDVSHKNMLVELDACKKSDCCPQMVRFYGAMLREGSVWICMEVMDTSLDKFYKKTYAVGQRIPEPFCAKTALTIVEGLNFLKEQLNLIHRDIKPSNILLNHHGQVKICDFGISGHLTNSLATTVQAGCKPYMPPERIEGDTKKAYNARADVWSLGITLIEVATGSHPYAKWKNPFEQLKQVLESPAPVLPDTFSVDFRFFVARCLDKDYQTRPKYPELLSMKFLENARNEKQFSMSKFIVEILAMPVPGKP